MRRGILILRSFNSQRDGILLSFNVCSTFSFKGFNSQRDGILQSRKGEFNVVFLVSIPNGMKFYPSYQFNKNLLHCFNSQRDEILHDYCENIRGEDAEFQFPTGWNSTVYIKVKEIDSNGFNSQRDEILRAAEKIRLANQAGFNSQRDGILHFGLRLDRSLHAFQFPTGWNSTISLLALISPFSSFNSQRDGILPKRTQKIRLNCRCFNSQRDGILLWRP